MSPTVSRHALTAGLQRLLQAERTVAKSSGMSAQGLFAATTLARPTECLLGLGVGSSVRVLSVLQCDTLCRVGARFAKNRGGWLP